MVRPLGIVLVVAAGVSSFAEAQTVINGSAFALKSSGTTSGTTGSLAQDGYFGTYVTLAAPGAITFTANASGVAGSGINPDMTISIADYNQSFAVTSGTHAYTDTTPTLPAGTYFVRTQLDNDKTQVVNNTPITPSGMSLTLANLSISSNATVSNSSSDALALSAADTYTDNFRKGNATVSLPGAAVGDQVQVTLTNNAFTLGTYVSGFSSSDSDTIANTAEGNFFRSFIQGRFNALVPSNAGKWSSDETVTSTGASISTAGMSTVDQMLAYAAANGMSARQHNLIWGGGNQQPAAIQNLLNTIVKTTNSTSTRSTALTELKSAITNRITYYIQGTNTSDGKVRAADFQQLDVLNEALLTGNYFNALGYNPATNLTTTAQSYAGVAAIYKQVQDAVKAKGLNVNLYTNEYNVLQNSANTVTPSNTFGGGATSAGSDQYANWYRNEVEGINNAAITAGATGNVVTGIGSQYYPTSDTSSRGPAVIEKAMQNLSVEGLPISLTEFGGQPVGTSYLSDAPQIVDDTIRMMMGTPNVNTMMIWGWLSTGTPSQFGGGTALVQENSDGTFSLTAAGTRFEYLYGRGLDPTAPGANADGSNPDPLTTNLTATVGADGKINFNGFYGDYTLTIDGKQYQIDFTKGGTTQFVIPVPEPAMLSLAATLTLFGLRRKRH